MKPTGIKFCINIKENLITKVMEIKPQMRLLTLEIIYTEYPKEEWLQVWTDGSFKADWISIGAGEFCGLRSIYAPVGHIGSAFDG